MPSAKAKLIVVLPATLACLLSLTPASAEVQRHVRHKPPLKKQEAVPEPVLPPQPLPQPPEPEPLTLEQMPAIPPQVTFQNGQLTIVAQNSTLGDILRAVRSQTGAAVEVPANATERVVGQLGPALARDVLASLLNGSLFNYMILGSESDPSALQRVILTPKPAGVAVTQESPTTAARPTYVPPQVQSSPLPTAQATALVYEEKRDNASEVPDAQPLQELERGASQGNYGQQQLLQQQLGQQLQQQLQQPIFNNLPQ
jgi:hypothetical protein